MIRAQTPVSALIAARATFLLRSNRTLLHMQSRRLAPVEDLDPYACLLNKIWLSTELVICYLEYRFGILLSFAEHTASPIRFVGEG